MCDIRYGKEKLTKAVNILAISNDDIRKRLISATIYELSHITPDRDLPQSLRNDFDRLYALLTGADSTSSMGKIHDSVSQMSDDDVTDCIRQILDLHFFILTRS